jgi:hypothetical protein
VINALFRWWNDRFPILELILPLILTIVFAGWIYFLGGWPLVRDLLAAKRGAVYGALASLLGSLLGFVIAGVAIVIAESARLQFVKEAGQLGNLLDVFRMSITALSLGTLAALLALIVDSEVSPVRWVTVPLVFGTLLAFLRIVRAIWVLNAVVRYVARANR